MRSVPVIDLHQDLILHVEHESFFNIKNQTSFQQFIDSSVLITFATVFPYGENWHDLAFDEKIFSEIEKYENYAKEFKFKMIKSKNDFNYCLENNMKGVILHVEGMNTFVGSDSNWQILNKIFDLGVRSVALVHTEKNYLGGGNTDVDTGLSAEGKQVLNWSLENGVIFDLAHMNIKTFFESVEILEKHKLPIFISHGNAYELCENDRNYNREQLSLVAKSQGLTGIFFSKKFVTKKEVCSLDDLIQHFLYVKNNFGINALAIGTDFGGVLSGFPEGIKSLSDLPKVLKSLQDCGFSEAELEDVCYKNAQRLITSYLK